MVVRYRFFIPTLILVISAIYFLYAYSQSNGQKDDIRKNNINLKSKTKESTRKLFQKLIATTIDTTELLSISLLEQKYYETTFIPTTIFNKFIVTKLIETTFDKNQLLTKPVFEQKRYDSDLPTTILNK